MDKYILDTNLFFNMEAGLGLGSKTEDVVVLMTRAMKALKEQKKAEFYVPPKVVDEFLSFFEDRNQPFIHDFQSQLTVKSPHIHDIQVAGAVLYQMVDDVRTRTYRGMTIAEEEMQKAARLFIGSGEVGKKDFEMKIGPVVKNFRERYRQATRTGFLDSLADLDLIVLTKKLDGFLVSADEGVMRWGRQFGVKEISLPVFGKLIKEAGQASSGTR